MTAIIGIITPVEPDGTDSLGAKYRHVKFECAVIELPAVLRELTVELRLLRQRREDEARTRTTPSSRAS